MPNQPLDPITALKAIRTFAKVAVSADEPSVRAYELILREILNVCDQAMPEKERAKRRERMEGEGE